MEKKKDVIGSAKFKIARGMLPWEKSFFCGIFSTPVMTGTPLRPRFRSFYCSAGGRRIQGGGTHAPVSTGVWKKNLEICGKAAG